MNIRKALWNRILLNDTIARMYKCPHCGMATGGYLYGAPHDGYVGMATGGQYREGQEMQILDNDICLCDKGIRFIG